MTNYKDHMIQSGATIIDALGCLEKLSGINLMVLFVEDESGRVIGSITDGDIRRGLISGVTLLDPIETVMNTGFGFLTRNNRGLEKIRTLRESNKRLVPLLDHDGRMVKLYNFAIQKTILPIDVILMAGGRGERLLPLTLTTPKPLLKVGKKAIIDHNVDALVTYGVENIHVTVNYLAEQIEHHFDQRDCLADEKITCVREDAPLGTMGGTRLVKGLSNDYVIVMNSDLFTNIDYEDFFHAFIESGADMTVATVPYSVDIPYAVMDLKDNDVRSLKEKPTVTYYANAGIYLFKRELLHHVPNDTVYQATDFIEDLLKQSKKVTRYPIVGYWIDIGKHDDYQKVQDLVQHTRY